MCTDVWIDCGAPPDVTDGSAIYNLTIFGTSVAYECDEGFVIDSESTVYCNFDGNWIGQQPSCIGMCYVKMIQAE